MGIEVHSSPEVDVVDIVDDVKGFVFFEFFAAAERALPRGRLRRPDLPLVVDSVDVHFVREFRAVNYSRRPWRRTARAHWIKRRNWRCIRGPTSSSPSPKMTGGTFAENFRRHGCA